MNQERAETIALQALAFVAGDERALTGLLRLTGMDLSDLRRAASDPEMLAGVLDFLLQDESALLAFCEAAGIAPEEPAGARARLPGGDLPHYT
ncbi:MAG: DUF3572 family protein [Alphaproteobacteria bacterium]|nr:DUF3572 family protein [Alphaproteobacteria bacterium]